jgi:hypothetical protein
VCLLGLTRVDAPVLATQPFAVQKSGAGEVDHATATRKPLDRLAVERLPSSSAGLSPASSFATYVVEEQQALGTTVAHTTLGK